MTTEALDDARQAAPTEPSVTEPASQPAKDTAAPAPGTEQDPPVDDQPTETAPKRDARDEAIRRLAVEGRETKRQLREANERLAAAQPAKDPNAPLTQADVDRLAEQKAQAIVANRETTAKDEAWVAAGNAEYPDFNERCNALADMGAAENAAFMTAIRKLPATHKVLAELADDPAEATRILKLSPVEMALELAGISARIAAPVAAVAEPEPRPVTRAPAPIKPLTTTSRAEVRPEDMTPDQYQAYWNKKTRGPR